MVERSKNSAAVHVTLVDDRSVMLLKTWLHPRATETRSTFAGQGMPLQVGETARLSGALVLCMGPQEWWIVCRKDEASELTQYVDSELAPRGLMRVDVTDALTAVEVSGPSARDLLSKGCGLDLDPRVFGAWLCARTRFAQIPVVVTCVGDSRRFELYALRSHTQYLRSWLIDAALELSNEHP